MTQENVFISYSRRDQVFARRLFERLDAAHFTAWADWDGIPTSAEWWSEIQKGIERTQSFICILSPAYLMSKTCNDELAYARKLQKQIIPVVRREVREPGGEFTPEIRAALYGKPWAAVAEENDRDVSRLNYLFFRKKAGFECEYDDITRQVLNQDCDGIESDADEFEAAFARLLKTMQENPAYLTEHTRLTVRAREWEANGKGAAFLLRDPDLLKAEQWLEANRDNQPGPSPLQTDYIRASRLEHTQAQQREHKRERDLAQARFGLVLAIVLIILLGIVFLLVQNQL